MSELIETIEIKLPVSGRVVVLRGYLTGRINNAVKLELMKGRIETTKDGKPAIDFTPEATELANQLAIRMSLISIDGKTENVWDEVQDLNATDYDAVTDEVNKAQAPFVTASPAKPQAMSPASGSASETGTTTPSTTDTAASPS